MAGEVVQIIQTSYVTSSKNRSQIKDLRNKAHNRQSTTDPGVWLSIGSLLSIGVISPFLSIAGVISAINYSSVQANLRAEEDLYSYIDQQFDRGYSYVKLKQKYYRCKIYTEDGGLIQEGWVKSGLPTVVSYVF